MESKVAFGFIVLIGFQDDITEMLGLALRESARAVINVRARNVTGTSLGPVVSEIPVVVHSKTGATREPILTPQAVLTIMIGF